MLIVRTEMCQTRTPRIMAWSMPSKVLHKHRAHSDELDVRNVSVLFSLR